MRSSGGRQALGQGIGLRADDDGVLFVPPVVPGLRVGLRVKVDDDRILRLGCGRSREVDRQRGLAGTALLGDTDFDRLWAQSCQQTARRPSLSGGAEATGLGDACTEVESVQRG